MRDAIKKSVTIHAPIERVWELVCEPGWWINNGRLTTHRIEYDERRETCVVHDEELGAFTLGIGVIEPPHRAGFTWLAGTQNEDVPASTVEFVLTEQTAGTVILTVIESGLSALSPDQHAATYDENVAGWEQELGLARAALDHGA